MKSPILARFTIVACVAGIIGGCSDPCSDAEIAEAKSPDGIYTAIMFQRDCGATTGFSTQVSILKTGQSVSGAGNVFVADSNQGTAAPGNWEGPWVEMQWRGSKTLLIHYAVGSRVFVQKTSVSGISVEYSN